MFSITEWFQEQRDYDIEYVDICNPPENWSDRIWSRVAEIKILEQGVFINIPPRDGKFFGIYIIPYGQVKRIKLKNKVVQYECG